MEKIVSLSCLLKKMAKKLSFSVESILSSDNSSSGCCYPSESNGINAVMKGRSYEQRRHSYTSCYERTSDDQPTLPCSPPSSASSTPDLASSAPELCKYLQCTCVVAGYIL